MKSLLRFAVAIFLATQLTGCQSATGLLNGTLGTFSRLLSAGGRTVGITEAAPVSEPLKMDPRTLDDARREAAGSALPEAKPQVATLAQTR